MEEAFRNRDKRDRRCPLQMMKGLVVFGWMLVVRPPARDKLHFQRVDLLSCSLRAARRAISRISGFRSSAIFSDFSLCLRLLLSRPLFSSTKTSITAFSFFTPSPSVPRSLFPLWSLFFPSIFMWNNMSYAISMARLCYLWGSDLGRPSEKGVSFRTRDESGRRRQPKFGAISPPSLSLIRILLPSSSRNSLSPAYIIYDPSFHFSATPTRPATVA